VSPPDFSVVIPLYNEAENIPVLQDEIRAALAGRRYEVILVDDGSTDGSASQVKPSPEVRLLRFARNAGQSAAMLAGLRAAASPVIVLLDGDLQNDPADIPRLLEHLNNGADLVCGYRVHRQDSRVKKISSLVANAVRRRFIGDGVRDTGCTLKALRRECIAALVPFQGMHRFIPALIKNAGFRVVEAPVHHRARRFGVSKYGLGNRALRATLDMIGVRWLQARRLDYSLREDGD
jgi:dolichol-phosphate mannosyltransferase